MKLSVTTAGNDHRLGANEAPPAIVSVFLGDELTQILDSIENDTFFDNHQKIQMNIGASVLPHFYKDNTDRNRTSPFAFTGNKFEFRMLGSSVSVADPNIVLNTAVAKVLDEFNAKLEGVAEDNITDTIHTLLKESLKAHKRVVFNGNGYSDEWVKEAEGRGLYNLKSTPETLPVFVDKKNVELFTKYGIFTEAEINSRYEIQLENYVKTLHIESRTLQDMVRREFLPALMEYTDELVTSINGKKSIGSACNAETKLAALLSDYYDKIFDYETKLEEDTATAENMSDSLEAAKFYHDTVLADMDELRKVADKAEEYIPDDILPYPNYEKLLFYI